ncbi:MAG: hypothetical protein ACE5Z5_10220 [Candidatus Bathyarchaeia archaeon]
MKQTRATPEERVLLGPARVPSSGRRGGGPRAAEGGRPVAALLPLDSSLKPMVEHHDSGG